MAEERARKIEAYQGLSPFGRASWRARRRLQRARQTGELRRNVVMLSAAVMLALAVFSLLDQSQRYLIERTDAGSDRRSMSLSEMYDRIAGYLERDERRELEREERR